MLAGFTGSGFDKAHLESNGEDPNEWLFVVKQRSVDIGIACTVKKTVDGKKREFLLTCKDTQNQHGNIFAHCACQRRWGAFAKWFCKRLLHKPFDISSSREDDIFSFTSVKNCCNKGLPVVSEDKDAEKKFASGMKVVQCRSFFNAGDHFRTVHWLYHKEKGEHYLQNEDLPSRHHEALGSPVLWTDDHNRSFVVGVVGYSADRNLRPKFFIVDDIVQRINRSLESGTPDETHNLLQKPEGNFPRVLRRSALLYHNGLRQAAKSNVKQRKLQEHGISQLSHEVICTHLKVLTAVVTVNEAIEKKNATQFTEELNNVGLTSVEESLCNRYLSQLILAKKDKAQVDAENVDLTKTELQECVEVVNNIVQEKRILLKAVIAINKEIDNKVTKQTLDALLNSRARLENVISDLAEDYQSTLFEAKSRKCNEVAQALLEFPETNGVDNNKTFLTHAEIQRIINQVYEDLDETLAERIAGLAEMFPESVRSGAWDASRGISSVAKWVYNFTGRAVWIVSTSFVLLAVPIMVEVERLHADQVQLRQRRQILLGSGSASGMEQTGYPVPQPNETKSRNGDYKHMFKAGSS